MQGVRNQLRLIPSTSRPVMLVSGAYRAKTRWGILQNILRARRVSVSLWNARIANICPHTNSMFITEYDDNFLNGYLEILRRCDGIVMVDGWHTSQGARAEFELAAQIDIPIFTLSECLKKYGDQKDG